MGSVGNKQSQVYKQAKEYILKNGIPKFIMGSDDERRDAFRAIADFGKLTKEEESILNRIEIDDSYGKPQLYFQGGRVDIDGDDDKVILGKKKFMARKYINYLNNR